MDALGSGAGPVRAGEGDARLDARVRRMSLLWWAAAFAVSCLLYFAAEAPRLWLADAANYAAGSGMGATWSLLLAGWLGRRRRARRKAFGAGLALAVVGGLLSGLAAALSSGLAAAALNLPQTAVFQIGFDLEHYTALFLAWYFIYLLLFSVEQTARIEEGVLRLRVLVLKAEDAVLRERVQPEVLSGAFSRMRAALAGRKRKEAESVVMALADSLRAALSSQGPDAPPEGRRPGEDPDAAEAASGEDGVSWLGARVAASYPLMDCAFWLVAFCVLIVAFAPGYIQSSLRTKAFFLAYWLVFCVTGCVAGPAIRSLWSVLSQIEQGLRKCLVVVAIALCAAFVSAWVPAEVSALFWGRAGPNLLMVLTGAEYYFPLYVVWHCVFFYAAAIRREMAQRTVLVQTAEAAAAARISMLRYQVRPHFLFNALNALFALIADGCWERAHAMTEALSAYIERSFAQDERELVPICEQVEALQTYLSIERVRFGDRLRFRLDIPERLAHACAPSLILQPLIENAMKYAVAATAGPVDVEIAADRFGDTLLLRVRDSGGDLEAPAEPGLGIGLRNVAARLAGHYGDQGSLQCKRLTPKGFIAEIRLPLEFACTPSAA